MGKSGRTPHRKEKKMNRTVKALNKTLDYLLKYFFYRMSMHRLAAKMNWTFDREFVSELGGIAL